MKERALLHDGTVPGCWACAAGVPDRDLSRFGRGDPAFVFESVAVAMLAELERQATAGAVLRLYDQARKCRPDTVAAGLRALADRLDPKLADAKRSAPGASRLAPGQAMATAGAEGTRAPSGHAIAVAE